MIRRLNDNHSDRELVKYIDGETFHYIYKVYELYCALVASDRLPLLNLDLWRHKPEKNLLYEILLGTNTSYTHKILFYAQTEYLLRNDNIIQERYEEWMRVVRNILSRADITVDGKRNDIVRSPEAFYGAINLVSELAEGCGSIYHFLYTASLTSSFAREQVKEEMLKAEIICKKPEQKGLIFRTEDNELLRGKIMFALECANYKSRMEEIDFGLFAEIQVVFEKYFKKLVIQLIAKSYDEIIDDFKKPAHMENWQYRLIKEERLLADCKSKYIAIPKDRTCCYLLRGKRPSDTAGSPQIK